MKKLIAVLGGLLLGNFALACNMDRDNCADVMLPELKRYSDELAANPNWKKNADPADAASIKRYQSRLDMCSTNKCVNETLFYFTNQMRGLAGKYRQAAAPTKVVPAQIQDKWSDQCVVINKANAPLYSDSNGQQQTGKFNLYVAYSVTKTTGGQLVGLTTVPDYDKPDPMAGAGKFAGWARKSDLEMQDLRNCN